MKKHKASILRTLKSSVLARNTIWMFGGLGISLVNQAVYFIILARLLGVEQYGLIVGANAVIGIVSQYSSCGFGIVLMRYVGHQRHLYAAYCGALLTVTTIGGIIIVGLLYVTAGFTLPKTPVHILMALAFGDCLCSQLTGACAQVFQTHEQMRMTALLSVAINSMRMLAALFAYLLLGHLTASQWVYFSMSVSLIVAFFAVALIFRSFGLPSIDLSLIKKRILEGAVFALSGSTNAIYNDVDKAILGHYGMNAANGAYSVAYRILDVGSMPIRAVHSAAFPKFFRLGSEGLLATEPFARSLLKKTVPLGLLAGLGIFVTAPLIPHLIGTGFAETAIATQWLCLIPLFRCFHVCAGDALAGAGKQPIRLAMQAVAAVTNLCLNLYLIPLYSWRGAAGASLATDAGLGIASWLILLSLRKRESVYQNRNDTFDPRQ